MKIKAPIWSASRAANMLRCSDSSSKNEILMFFSWQIIKWTVATSKNPKLRPYRQSQILIYSLSCTFWKYTRRIVKLNPLKAILRRMIKRDSLGSFIMTRSYRSRMLKSFPFSLKEGMISRFKLFESGVILSGTLTFWHYSSISFAGSSFIN